MEFKKYLGKYATSADVQSAIDSGTLNKPYVAYIESGGTLDWNSKTIDYSTMPLTFEITSDGEIKWEASNTNTGVKTIEYSKNGGEWTSITSATGSSAPSISVVSGDTVQFRGNNANYGSGTSSMSTFNRTTCQFKLKGNIMSLINSTNFSGLTTLSTNYAFIALFNNCTGLTDASKLLLPATTLTYYCYANMFYRCSSLTTAPELPATTLATSCCYGMFNGCSNLNYIKCLATDISASNCTTNWVSGVASTGTFECPSTTDWSSKTGTSGIPTNWTRVDA